MEIPGHLGYRDYKGGNMKGKETYKIERGIEIPPKRGKENYPLREMEVGDSFLVPNSKKWNCGVFQPFRKKGIFFCQRKVEEGIRIWRIK